ncbi:hypothetical protein DRN62_02665 [Nanoarchaeota archaeon]|nr:MAG: hypothetical protein DRN62_02665 [Nanoarchaeota archaeon]
MSLLSDNYIKRSEILVSMNMKQLRTLLRRMKLEVPISFTEYALLIEGFEIEKIEEEERPLVQIPSLTIRRKGGTLRVPASDIYDSLMEVLKRKGLTPEHHGPFGR